MGQRARVLVVDDDEDIRRLAVLRLRDLYDTVEAGSGPAAIEVVRAGNVDLVLLDVMMPGMTGVEACPKLKALNPDAFLPVLLLTALDDQASRNAGLQMGADDYLSKPVDAIELRLRVRHFLKLRQQDLLIREQMAEVKRLEALRDDMTSMLVHDLRNPLVGVIGALDLMSMSTHAVDADVLELGRNSAQRVMDLIEDLLRTRMLEDGGLDPVRAPTALAEVASAAIASVAPAVETRGMTLRVTGETGLVANVDRKLLQRAMENLLANAVRYSRESIEVIFTTGGAELFLDVADRGPGVPEHLKSTLFTKYASVETKLGKVRRGHGLGLYLVGLVMRAHGGRVEVLDREGGGSIFRLALPSKN